ncbi:lipoyl(octanoyl) transferase LipB [bacterium]|jgi:lipoate-protein ligase B|nr:lipoyl(octanoyl) transferase LipB [bacterium]
MKVKDFYDIDYEEMRDIQRKEVSEVISGGENRVLFPGFHHIMTTGRDFKKSDLLVTDNILNSLGIKVFAADRGGNITYHGPGQIVCYPVINLKYWKKDVNLFIRVIENVIIAVLAKTGIAAVKKKQLTGVWVKDKKIASIGIGFSKWVSYHGFSLNVEPGLYYFSIINPCGIRDAEYTSINKETGKNFSIELLKGYIIDELECCFNKAAALAY